jgi:hypothetical protein
MVEDQSLARSANEFGTVDEFVAVEASEITRLQQPPIRGKLAIVESKGLPRRISG